MSVLGIVASSLDRFATEIRLLQKTEGREVEEPFGTGQKGFTLGKLYQCSLSHPNGFAPHPKQQKDPDTDPPAKRLQNRD
jgi:hypothetical protein